MSAEPVEIVIRLQLELPPGLSLMATPVQDEPLAYRIPAAAELIGIGQSKLRELIARELAAPGTGIESVSVDGARRIPAHALRAYMARQAGGDHAKAG